MLAQMPASSVRRSLGEFQVWPTGLADDLPQRPWVVVHARPRQDKLLACHLRRLGLPGLLFLERRERTYPRQGVQISLVPLLPGYLFILADPMDHDTIYSTERVVRVMAPQESGELRSDLLDLIALTRGSDAPVQVRPELVPGRPVVLRAGSLAGLQGVVVRRQGHCELVVNVRMLGTSVAVSCDEADVDLA